MLLIPAANCVQLFQNQFCPEVLRAVTAMIPASEFLILCGDWNGHVRRTGSGYKEVYGGYGYGKPDPDSEGEMILEYALAYDLFLGNTCFKKRDSHLITYRSGNTATQIDFVLLRKSLRKLVMDVKVIPGEEVALQHQLLVCDMIIDMPPQIKRKFTPRPKVWKLKRSSNVYPIPGSLQGTCARCGN